MKRRLNLWLLLILLILFTLATLASPHTYDSLKFKKIKEFNIKIPNSYYNAKLIPGKIYIVKIFLILGNTNIIKDCVDFLSNEKAILMGIYGLDLVYSLAKKELPREKYIFSFDENDSFHKNPEAKGKFLFPFVYISRKFEIDQTRGSYADNIDQGDYLFFLCETN